MIRFKVIRYKNFLATGNYWTEIQLDKDPLTVIVGDNGVGKSTILDALCFCLFKKPFRKVTLPLLVNSITKKNTLVEVEFEIGSTHYKVVRGLKPNKFEIWKDGTQLNEERVGEMQTYLEKNILHVNHKAFCQVVIIGKTSYTPFMSLDTADRRKVIENILDLEIISVMNKVVTERLKKLAVEIIPPQQKIGSINKELVFFRTQLQKKTDDLDNQIAHNKALHDSKGEQIEELRKELGDLKNLYPDSQEIVSKNNKLIGKSQERMIEIRSEMARIEKDTKFFDHSLECPTCRQHIDPLFKSSIITKNEVALCDLGTRLNKGQAYLDLIMKEYEEHSKNLETKRLALNKVESQILNLESERDGIYRIIGSLQNQKDEDDIGQEISTKEQELQAVETEYNALIEIIENLKDFQKFLKDDGIKANIISKYIPKINDFINYYLDKMDFLCQFTLDENFNEIIKSRYRDEFKYESFSEGQKFRIDLALLFTWRAIAKARNSINTNLLFFDETLDSSLDDQGVNSFIQIIKTLTSGANTFIISHNERNIDKINNTLRIEMIKGFTHVSSD